MNSELRMVFLIVIIAAVIGVLMFYATPPVAAPSTETIPFTPIVQGTNSNIANRVNYLITSPEELKDLWKLIGEASVPPVVDFKTQSVIALFAGERPSTGYSISVSKIEDTEVRNVLITLTKPDDNCVVGTALTYPYEIAIVPASSLKFTHEDVQVVKTCP